MESLHPDQIDKLFSLRPGTMLDVQISTPVNNIRVKTEYIGVYQERYLIVQYPDPRKWGPVQDHIVDGKKVVVRFLLERDNGEVVAFRTKVAAVVGHPVKMIFLSFPEKIESLSLREQPRIKTLLSAELEIDGESYSGMMVDISLTGGGLVLKSPIEIPNFIGKKASLQIQMSGSKDLVFRGKICNQRTDNMLHHIGFQFNEDEKNITTLFDNLLIDVSLLEHQG